MSGHALSLIHIYLHDGFDVVAFVDADDNGALAFEIRNQGLELEIALEGLVCLVIFFGVGLIVFL